jgi:hypothetical protein
MKIYSPWDEPKTVMYDGTDYVLAANAVTELSDVVGDHVLRRYSESGMRGLTGDPEVDAAVCDVAEDVHTKYLRSRLRENSYRQTNYGGPIVEHPAAEPLRVLIASREERRIKREIQKAKKAKAEKAKENNL